MAAKKLVLSMFSVMGVVWGDKMKGNKPELLTMETINAWTVSLVHAKMTQAEFDIAMPLSISAEREWPPSTPADFLALARFGSNSRYPEINIAYAKAANGCYLHPVCHAAAERVGLWQMRHDDEFTTKKLWLKIYPVICDEYSQNSAKFNQNAIAIEHKRQSDMPALEVNKNNPERQIEITMAAVKKIRETK